MNIWKNSDQIGITPPNHFGDLKVVDIVPFAEGDFSVQISRAPKGGGGELHHHDSWSQVFYIMEGALTFDTGKERFTLTKGQAVLLEPKDPHYTLNEQDEDCIAMVITVKH